MSDAKSVDGPSKFVRWMRKQTARELLNLASEAEHLLKKHAEGKPGASAYVRRIAEVQLRVARDELAKRPPPEPSGRAGDD